MKRDYQALADEFNGVATELGIKSRMIVIRNGRFRIHLSPATHGISCRWDEAVERLEQRKRQLAKLREPV